MYNLICLQQHEILVRAGSMLLVLLGFRPVCVWRLAALEIINMYQ